MSKGPWKKRPKGSGIPKGKVVETIDVPTHQNGHAAPVGEAAPAVDTLPPPLPPLSPPDQPPVRPAGGPVPLSQPDQVALKSGVAKTFISVTKAAPYWANLGAEAANLKVRFELETVSAEEGELWAEFAWPLIERYMPKFKESPEWALAVITVSILAGKVRIKKREVPVHVHASETDRNGQVPPLQ